MKIVVTGCNGQVGSSLVNLLEARENVELVAVDRNNLDITNEQDVVQFIANMRPDIIINAAAYTAVDNAEDEADLAYSVNRDGPLYLAKAAQNVNAAILHISTDYVFQGTKDGLYQETDIADPQGIYGQSKLAGELAVADSCDKHIILRTAWVFGEYGPNFVKTMLRLGTSRDHLSIVDDQVGGPTYAYDIAKALITISEAIVAKENVDYGIYHFSGLPHVSWFEFSAAIFDEAEQQSVLETKPMLSPITTNQYPTKAMRPANSRLDTSKITECFGVHASDWKKAIIDLKAYRD